MKLKLTTPFVIATLLLSQCREDHPIPRNANYPSDVANSWMQMQIRLTKSTAGYNSIVSNRSFGYAGITMYQSIAPAIPGGVSLLSKIGVPASSIEKNKNQYYWPASLNAAMATITRQFFESTSSANLQAIDSLETVYQNKFKTAADAGKITNSENYGRQVANAIFEWSKTDGGHQAYKHLNDPNYVPPTGAGLWVPTSPAPALLPHWGDNRTFIADAATLTQPDAPTPYSKDVNSAFYAMVNEVYTVSLSLTKHDSTTVKFWADTPGHLNVPAHATNILAQILVVKKSDLYNAAIAYALHGIALSDAAVSVMKTKYTYNLVRPISYIRKELEKSTWTTVIPSPPHPEYSAAHAVVSAASATVLENLFGKNYNFTDHSYDNKYGARSFNSFEEYAKQAGQSRLLGGIHYSLSITVGLKQGVQIGNLVNSLNGAKQ